MNKEIITYKHNVECEKCNKAFIAKSVQETIDKDKYSFFCGPCAMKMIESGEF